VAERAILVCDVCGEPASETVSFKVGTRTLLKDFCSKHLAELTAGARRPRRGRKPKSATQLQAAPRRPRRASKKTTTARRPTRQIKDTATLEKRRAALAKARQALAEKRAAAKAG
jgi:hypothetical protein